MQPLRNLGGKWERFEIVFEIVILSSEPVPWADRAGPWTKIPYPLDFACHMRPFSPLEMIGGVESCQIRKRRQSLSNRSLARIPETEGLVNLTSGLPGARKRPLTEPDCVPE